MENFHFIFNNKYEYSCQLVHWSWKMLNDDGCQPEGVQKKGSGVYYKLDHPFYWNNSDQPLLSSSIIQEIIYDSTDKNKKFRFLSSPIFHLNIYIIVWKTLLGIKHFILEWNANSPYSTVNDIHTIQVSYIQFMGYFQAIFSSSPFLDLMKTILYFIFLTRTNQLF